MEKQKIQNILDKYIKGGNNVEINKNGLFHNRYSEEYINDIYSKRMHKVLSEKEPELYDFLKQTLSEKFTAEELYLYLHKERNGDGQFMTLSAGYHKYKMDGKLIDLSSYCESKLDLLKFVVEHSGECFTYKKLKRFTNITKKFPEISDVNSHEELYLCLSDQEPHKCEVCGKPTQFLTIYDLHRPYKQFCCDDCRQKWWAGRQHENNTTHRMSDESKIQLHNKLSKVIKDKIHRGEWTPNVTNSWCRSKIKISFKTNSGEIKTLAVRSSWEAFFQLVNPTYEYEKLRIKFFHTEQQIYKNYIVDFIDEPSKQVFEVKPEGVMSTQTNIDKFRALSEWCKTNNYKMNIISDEYFKSHVFNYSLLQYVDNENKEKILRLFNKNKFNIDYEN